MFNLKRVRKDTITVSQPLSYRSILIVMLMLMSLSGLAFLYNRFVTHYVGLPYYWNTQIVPPLMIATAYIWYEVRCASGKIPLQFMMEATLYFISALVFLITCTAVQYTPNPPIDATLIGIERYCHISLEALIHWSNQHPALNQLLTLSYASISLELYLIPIMVLIMKRYNEVREFCFLLLTTALIGLSFYYFFPTTGPGSLLNSPYFSNSQYATGIKFWQIHQHRTPSTWDGGMVSMPSFHMIWAWLCVYITRLMKPLFYVVLFNNSVMVMACILLGWHYPIDLLGSIVTVLMAHWLLYRWRSP